MTITDSGGLQKETFLLKTPGIILRDTTEWIETLGDNHNVLASIDSVEIIEKSKRKVNNDVHEQNEPFGSGDSAEKIIFSIEKYFMEN